MKENSALSFHGYPAFLAEVKERVLRARTVAGRAVNRELVLLYWDIGRGIVEKQQAASWGDGVVEKLASDLKAKFPDVRGFSAASIWRMRQFYEEYSSSGFMAVLARELERRSVPLATDRILAQLVREFQASAATASTDQILAQLVRELVAQVPWGHHINVLSKLPDPAARLYYLRATASFGWSRNVLLNQIKGSAYERAVKEKKAHNFELALPEHLAEQADEMLKSRYSLEFLGIHNPVRERELEERLITHLQRFILELGYGFCFIGRQYRLALKSKEYFVDLLFYHRFLKALVAFDLKVGPFEPEHAGKMDFYLNLLNDKERGPGDEPSIGIILCAEKDDVEVEFALRTKANPIGVAEYELKPRLPAALRGKLPTAKQLAEVVREVLPKGK